MLVSDIIKNKILFGVQQQRQNHYLSLYIELKEQLTKWKIHFLTREKKISSLAIRKLFTNEKTSNWKKSLRKFSKIKGKPINI